MIYEAISTIISPFVGSGIGRIKLLADLYQFIMPRIMPKKAQIIEAQGFKMKIVNAGHIEDLSTELLFKKVHEPATTRIFKEILKDGDFVVDVGANIGYFTLLASKIVGESGGVFAFEPSEENIKSLLRNVNLNEFAYKNTWAYEFAIGDHMGVDTFYLSSRESARHSLIKTKEHDQQTNVQVVMLDHVIAGIKKPIRLLKTDTEGNELAVLIGAREIIKKNPNICLIVEINQDAMDACGVSFHSLWNYMVCELGMKYFYLIDDYADKVGLIFRSGYFWQDWQKSVTKKGSNRLACNILCSRNNIQVTTNM